MIAPVEHRYRVRVVPELHELEVELQMTLPGPRTAALFVLPTWVPGAYALMRYARDLFSVEARDLDSGRALKVTREGWSGFHVEGPVTAVGISYRVSAFDPAWGELVGFVDEDHALFLGTRLLFLADTEGPCRVNYLLPSGWALHHPAGAKPLSEFEYLYPAYRTLLDSPVVVGTFQRQTRLCHGVAFHTVFVDHAAGQAEGIDSLISAFMAVAEETYQLFGTFPFQHYTFICSTNPTAHWGLEHASSTMVSFGPHVFIDPARRADAIRVVAHELFHAWNVCRLRPAPLEQMDLVHGSFPDALWVSEGFTRYYEFLLCVRAKELTPEALFSNVLNFFCHLQAMPAYGRVALADSSRAAFLNHSKYPGSINNTIDFYDKGMLVAFELDAFLRVLTPADSLDSAFADFYTAFVGKGAGFSSQDLQDFMERRAPGAGVLLEQRVNAPGGLTVLERLESLGFSVESHDVWTLGLVLKENLGPELANVLDDSPAGRAGFAAGDVLLQVDGHPFDLKTLKWLIRRSGPMLLSVRRGARTLVKTVSPVTRRDPFRLTWVGGAPERLERIQMWLKRPELKWKDGEEIALGAFDNFHGIQAVI